MKNQDIIIEKTKELLSVRCDEGLREAKRKVARCGRNRKGSRSLQKLCFSPRRCCYRYRYSNQCIPK